MENLSDEEVKRVVEAFQQHTFEAEALGEQILIDKQQVVDFDRRRQQNREALTQLRKQKKGNGLVQEVRKEKAWMYTGSLFIQLPKEKAVHLLQEDQKHLDQTIHDLQDEMKMKVAQLERIDRVLAGQGASVEHIGQDAAAMARLKPLK